MKTFKAGSILLILCVFFVAFTSCGKINERLDILDQRLEKLENITIASVNAQITNINNSIPGIEQTIENLKLYVTLLKQEKVNEFSVSITNIENYIVSLNNLLTEIKNFTQYITNQETVNNEMWVDITIKTMNLYQSIQNQLSLAKVEITNVKQMITNLKIEVDQKLLELNATLLTFISHTETSIMSWMNERFTAYYTIAEVNAKIQNLIIENNVEINASIEELTMMVNEMNLEISNLYSTVIQEVITYNEGVISDMMIQKIEDATVNLNVSMETINARITEIENKIIIIDNSINTVNQQVSAINVSIEQIALLQEQITQYITVLMQEGDTYSSQIILLQQIQDELDVKIQELDVYVENVVNNFNTTITDTRSWVSLTFSTIEQYTAINSTITNIQAMINIVQTNILEINQSIVNINSDITNVQNSVTVSIANLDKSTQEWVNKKLAEYMTISEANKQFNAFRVKLAELDKFIEDTEQAALYMKMEDLEKQLVDMNSNITAIVKKAVEEAIINHDGNLQAQISELKEALDTFSASVSSILDALKNSIDKLMYETEQIKNDLYESIQSITPIPTYSDGSVAVNSGVSDIEFEIFPIMSPQTVSSAVFIKCLSFDVLKVQTKAGSSDNPLINLPISRVEMSGDFLKVYINFANIDKNILSENQAIMGRLRFNNGSMFKSSGYFLLNMNNQTSTSAYIISTYRNTISGSYDVTNIVFKYNDNTVTSGVEVQASDSPEKIYANINGTTMTISTPASQIYAPERCDMFCKMDKLTSVDFGTGFNTSMVKDMSSMFYYTSIASLDLSKFDFSNVDDVRTLFYCMEKLEYLDLGTIHLPKISKYDGMCYHLANLSEGCTIRCSADTQKFLRENGVQLNENKIKWELTD